MRPMYEYMNRIESTLEEIFIFSDEHKGKEALPEEMSKSQYSTEYTPVPFDTMEDSNVPRRPRKRSSYFWTWEWISMVVSFCAIVGSVVLLKMFDNRPLPHWAYSKHGLSLNTILSVLSTISRTYLLIPLDECMGQLMWIKFAENEYRPLVNIKHFDLATRSVSGAVKLMFVSNVGEFAKLASLLLVASYGLGIAQQQLIAYPSRAIVLENTTALVTSATSYQEYENVTVNGVTTLEMAYGILASMYNSIISADAIPEHYNSSGWNAVNMPFFTCNSGDCQFAPFNSLAVCYECNDMSASISSSCQTDTQGEVCVASYAPGDSTSTSFSVPSTSNMNTLINQTIINTTSSSTLSHIPPKLVIAGFSTIGSTNSFPANSTAVECALFWCVKTYNASVAIGIYLEDVSNISTTAEYGTGDSYLTFPDPSGNSSSNFSVTQTAHTAITDPIRGLPSKIQGWAAGIPGSEIYTYSSDIIRGLQQINNLTAAVALMSIGLSNHVRNAALSDGPMTPSSQGVNLGHTLGQQTYVRVRWFWLIFPAGLWFVSVVFFVNTVIRASCSRRGKFLPEVYGINPLAYLFHGLDERSRRTFGDLQWSELEKIAETAEVRMVDTSQGLKLGLRESERMQKGRDHEAEIILRV
ncbi:hypothetical protein RUND412_002505 [Rhizina undulata]